MTDESNDLPQADGAGVPASDARQTPAVSMPTPEERLAETTADDPDVGVDGIGVGELP